MKQDLAHILGKIRRRLLKLGDLIIAGYRINLEWLEAFVSEEVLARLLRPEYYKANLLDPMNVKGIAAVCSDAILEALRGAKELDGQQPAPPKAELTEELLAALIKHVDQRVQLGCLLC
jgi:hypothetical protein